VVLLNSYYRLRLGIREAKAGDAFCPELIFICIQKRALFSKGALRAPE
jgi:hypothetical protein